MLRALSLCTCCRHYPGAATDGPALLIHPVISAFPERVVGSACASSVSRLTQRSLTLRPAHSRCHRILWPAIRRLQPFRYLHDCSGCFRLEHFAGWGSHPLENAAFSRRTPTRVIQPSASGSSAIRSGAAALRCARTWPYQSEWTVAEKSLQVGNQAFFGNTTRLGSIGKKMIRTASPRRGYEPVRFPSLVCFSVALDLFLPMQIGRDHH